MTCKTVGFKN